MSPDAREWCAQVERRVDAAKTAVTSNARLPDSELAEIASQLETIKKRCRALVEGEGER